MIKEEDFMNQVKIGKTLKELRKAKGLTQEELAQKFYVTDRSVSRWETGSNLPDISVLIELADFYDVDIREIIDGEIKNIKMDEDLKDTLMKVADYESEDRKKFLKRVSYLFLAGIAGCLIYPIFDTLGLSGPLYEFIEGAGLGVGCGMCIIGFLLASGKLDQFREFKKRLFKKQ